MNRACQVHTTGFDLPDRRMISAVPQPSAVARITLARHTCFCGALRSATIASSRRRSARVTLTTIPALIMRAWTASADLGIVRMNQTTRARDIRRDVFSRFLGRNRMRNRALRGCLIACIVSVAEIAIADSNHPIPRPGESGKPPQAKAENRRQQPQYDQTGSEELPFFVKEAPPEILQKQSEEGSRQREQQFFSRMVDRLSYRRFGC